MQNFLSHALHQTEMLIVSVFHRAPPTRNLSLHLRKVKLGGDRVHIWCWRWKDAFGVRAKRKCSVCRHLTCIRREVSHQSAVGELIGKLSPLFVHNVILSEAVLPEKFHRIVVRVNDDCLMSKSRQLLSVVSQERAQWIKPPNDPGDNSGFSGQHYNFIL